MKKLLASLILASTLFLVGVPDAHAAVTLVNSTATSATGGTTVHYTIPSTTQGNYVFIALEFRSNSGPTLNSITDNVGNTYTIVDSGNFASLEYRGFAYGKQTTGGATQITASFSAFSTSVINIDEFTGVNTVTPIRGNSTGSGTGTSVSVGSLSTQSTDVVWGGYVTNNGVSWTNGSGYTSINQNGKVFTQYKVNPSATETAPATLSASQPWRAIAFAIESIPVSTSQNSLGFFRFFRYR